MKKALGLMLAAMLLFAALPGAAPADGTDTETPQIEAAAKDQTGTIVKCKTQVNVREKATSKSKLLGTAKKGEQFDVLGRFGSWVKIDFNGKEGYVYHSYIKVTGEPSDTAVEGKTGTIVNCKTTVNVREKADSGSKLVGTAKKGAKFKVLATAGNWVKIQYTDDKAGYVYKRYVKITAAEESIEGKTGTVTCQNKVNVRAKASKDSKLLGRAKNGETFTVKGRSGNWIKIDYNGKTGFIYKRYMKIG